MKRSRDNIRHHYNNIIDHLITMSTDIQHSSYRDSYETILGHLEMVLKRTPYSSKIRNLIEFNLESIYNQIIDYNVSQALGQLKYAKSEEADPSRYNIKFYQTLIEHFNDEVVRMEYADLHELLHKILVKEDCLDEISNIVYFMPTWFKDVMRSKIKLDDGESLIKFNLN